MLWVDTSKSSVQDKLMRGLKYFETKYGHKPDLTLVPVGEQTGQDTVERKENPIGHYIFAMR